MHFFGQIAPRRCRRRRGLENSCFWEHYRDCSPCSYADRTGDLRRVMKVSDFYSARQWHSTGMYRDVVRPDGIEHELILVLPAGPPWTAGPGRTVRLIFFRGPGPDFSERDRALLTLLRPHLHQACLDAERRRVGTPRLTRRQWELLRLVAAGHTNEQIARRLAYRRGPCASTWRTSTAGCTSPAAPPRSPTHSRPSSPPTADRATPLPNTARYRPG